MLVWPWSFLSTSNCEKLTLQDCENTIAYMTLCEFVLLDRLSVLTVTYFMAVAKICIFKVLYKCYLTSDA